MKLFKKSFFICVLFLALSLILSSCSYSKKEQQYLIAMFNSFDSTDNYIFETCDELHIGKKVIKLEDIKYNEKQCEILLLEEDGFYGYTYTASPQEIEIVYIYYENMQTEFFDKFAIPSKVITSFYCNNAFYFRIDDPLTKEFNQLYVIYDLNTKEIRSVDTDYVDVSETTLDNKMPTMYEFIYHERFGNDWLDITNKSTGVTKKVDEALFNTCKEGKLINKYRKPEAFAIGGTYVKDDDFYFVGYFGLNALGCPCYLYIWKWNFETEKVEYYTSVYFEIYPEWIDDLIIPEEGSTND